MCLVLCCSRQHNTTTQRVLQVSYAPFRMLSLALCANQARVGLSDTSIRSAFVCFRFASKLVGRKCDAEKKLTTNLVRLLCVCETCLYQKQRHKRRFRPTNVKRNQRHEARFRPNAVYEINGTEQHLYRLRFSGLYTFGISPFF